MAKRHVISKAATCRGSTEGPPLAVHLQAEDAKSQRPSSEDGGRSSALGMGLRNADGFMSWHDEFFSKGNTNQVYLVSTIEGERVAMRVTAAGRYAEDEKNRGDQLLQHRGC
jgi:hypothetical protein